MSRPAPAPAVIRLRDATIGYGDVPIVRGADLTVGPGEAVAVLGSNGSGKTTLARGLLGLATVLGGDVELLGAPVGRLSERGRVGYVPQRHSVTGAVPATVREVVGVGRLARLGLFRRLGAADRAAVTDAVAAVGLADRLDDPVAALSGGQQRRVLVARALAAEPELLIMDEPTAGVDAASQEALAGVLARISALGTTLVVVTHETAPLAGVLTRAVVVDHGRISYDGPLLPGQDEPDPHHHPAPRGTRRGYRMDQPTVTPRRGGSAEQGR
ncbi:metal ABC transporter ATP-binding protein [Blastococcus saxobsidens]|uniref:ABC-type Mn/Zn transport systems ATPase component n=1 Tax=Blastococcus saxobsidens (strain DD2) TaxID=1146883 RepID=H6RLF9_BLASD|nr:ATP-binding cassette domain-containing protein [Blastococcus saxobsidens]CCG02485.1 ABC-type Mn/Zn transport systems ATPase component [Blastococcus saxobsidens DD2]